jgi:peptidoglycan/xylan/chitin deacetylase (PgdA/CDA1 family)
MLNYLRMVIAIAALIAAACSAGGESDFVPTPRQVTPREVEASRLDLPAAPAPSACRGYVALSFDDGPSPLTSQLLAVLEHYDVPATFFNIGAQSRRNPRQVELTIQAGHQIGNHTMTHVELLPFDRRQLEREIDGVGIVHRSLGLATPAPLFRPPYGVTSPQIRAFVESRGLTEALWDKDSKDWEARTAEAIVQKSKGMGDGDILLLHDGKPLTIEALPGVIGHYHNQGLCFGRIAATGTERPASGFDTTHRAVAVSQ